MECGEISVKFELYDEVIDAGRVHPDCVYHPQLNVHDEIKLTNSGFETLCHQAGLLMDREEEAYTERMFPYMSNPDLGTS